MAEGPVVKNKKASTSVTLNSIRQNLKITNWLKKKKKVLIRNHLKKFFLFFGPLVISDTSNSLYFKKSDSHVMLSIAHYTPHGNSSLPRAK